jgi:hypothetical protein
MHLSKQNNPYISLGHVRTAEKMADAVTDQQVHPLKLILIIKDINNNTNFLPVSLWVRQRSLPSTSNTYILYIENS